MRVHDTAPVHQQRTHSWRRVHRRWYLAGCRGAPGRRAGHSGAMPQANQTHRQGCGPLSRGATLSEAKCECKETSQGGGEGRT